MVDIQGHSLWISRTPGMKTLDWFEFFGPRVCMHGPAAESWNSHETHLSFFYFLYTHCDMSINKEEKKKKTCTHAPVQIQIKPPTGISKTHAGILTQTTHPLFISFSPKDTHTHHSRECSKETIWTIRNPFSVIGLHLQRMRSAVSFCLLTLINLESARSSRSLPVG